MAVYTVHAPATADVRTSPDKVIFVRDGFYFWAFVAAIVWLIWHRLWLALVGYITIAIVGEIAFKFMNIGLEARFIVMFLFALLVGFEAGSLRRWKLSRGKWRQLDVVVADNEEAAERRFFDRWDGNAQRNEPRGSLSPLPPLPRASLPPQDDVVGFFPQPGAPR